MKDVLNSFLMAMREKLSRTQKFQEKWKEVKFCKGYYYSDSLGVFKNLYEYYPFQDQIFRKNLLLDACET